MKMNENELIKMNVPIAPWSRLSVPPADHGAHAKAGALPDPWSLSPVSPIARIVDGFLPIGLLGLQGLQDHGGGPIHRHARTQA